MKLVRDNSAQNVEDVTASAFEEYAVERDVLKAVKTLAQLRGIGPATASLLLSVLDLDEVPFFSDEVFRWVNWDEADSAKGGGWDRVIKYTAKEYKEVVERVGDVRERLGVRAVDVEMVAYVLGQEGADVGGEGEDEKEELEDEGKEEEEKSEEGGEEVEEGEGKEKRDGKGITDEAHAEIMEAINSGHAVFIANGKLGGKALVPTEEEEREFQAAKKGRKRKVVVDKAAVEGARRSTRRKT
jgi:hypothetical protein